MTAVVGPARERVGLLYGHRQSSFTRYHSSPSPSPVASFVRILLRPLISPQGREPALCRRADEGAVLVGILLPGARSNSGDTSTPGALVTRNSPADIAGVAKDRRGERHAKREIF